MKMKLLAIKTSALVPMVKRSPAQIATLTESFPVKPVIQIITYQEQLRINIALPPFANVKMDLELLEMIAVLELSVLLWDKYININAFRVLLDII